MKKISKKISFLQILLFALLTFSLSFGMNQKQIGPRSSSTIIDINKLGESLSFKYQQNYLEITFSILDYLHNTGKNSKFILPMNNLLSSFSIDGQSTATNHKLAESIHLPKFIFELLQFCKNQITGFLKKNGCQCTKEYLQEIDTFSSKVAEKPMTLHLVRKFAGKNNVRRECFLYPDTVNFKNWVDACQEKNDQEYQKICSVKVTLTPCSWLPNFDNNEYKKLISACKKSKLSPHDIFTDAFSCQNFMDKIKDYHRPSNPLENILFQFCEENPDLKAEMFGIYNNYKICHLHATGGNSMKKIQMVNNSPAFCSILTELLMNKYPKKTPIFLTNIYDSDKQNTDITNFFLGIIIPAIKDQIQNSTNGRLCINFFSEKKPEVDSPSISDLPISPRDNDDIPLFLKIKNLLHDIQLYTNTITTDYNEHGSTIITDGPVFTKGGNNFSEKFNSCCKDSLRKNPQGRHDFAITVKKDTDDKINFSGVSSISYIGTPWNRSLTLLKHSTIPFKDFFEDPLKFSDDDKAFLLNFQIFFHNKNNDNNFSSFEIPGIIPHDDQCHNKYHGAIQSLCHIVVNKSSSIPEMNAFLIALYYVLQKKMGLMKNGKNQKIIRLSLDNPSFFESYYFKHSFECLNKLIKFHNFFNNATHLKNFIQETNEKNNFSLSEDFMKNLQFALLLIRDLLLIKKFIIFATELCENPGLILHKKNIFFSPNQKPSAEKNIDNKFFLAFYSEHTNNILYEIPKVKLPAKNPYAKAVDAFEKFIILQTHHNEINQCTIPPIDNLEPFLPILCKILLDKGLIKENEYQTISSSFFNIIRFTTSVIYYYNMIEKGFYEAIRIHLDDLRQFFSDRDFLEKLPYPKNFLKDLDRAFLLIRKYCLNETKFIDTIEEFFNKINLNKSILPPLIDKQKMPYGIFIQYHGQKITKQIPLTNENTKEILKKEELFI